jgi:hypothetical protein
MTVLLYNRITGSKSEKIQGSSLLGAYQIEVSDREARLNSVPIESGDFLVPDAQAQWVLYATQEQDKGYRGIFRKEPLPGSLVVGSVNTLSEHFSGSEGWIEWMEVSPLVPKISERVKLQPMDRKIRDHLGVLESVCRKPRMYLELEIERLPVSRARRIPVKATNYLASHTEDWEKRTLRSVMPKRILSLVREDDYDIYENRVTARLIDKLQAYLDERIDEVRGLRDILFEASDYTSAAQGSRHRQDRIYHLWGESAEAGEKFRIADRTLKALEWTRSKLLSLKDSILYKRVPQRAGVETTLRMTNVLVNDHKYRHVAYLWRQRALLGMAEKKKPSVIYKEWQTFCHGFDRFCMLLTIRALQQLKIEPIYKDVDKSIALATEISLKGTYVAASMRWNEDGSVIFKHDQRVLLRLVPLSTSLSSISDEDYLKKAVGDMVIDSNEDKPLLTLILYPPGVSAGLGKVSETLQDRLHSLANDSKEAIGTHLGFLPVSPWEIGSVERITRALRWVFMGRFMLQYPPIIEGKIPASVPMNRVSEWLNPLPRGEGCSVLRLPRSDEEHLLKVEGRHGRLSGDIEALEGKIAVTDGRERSRLRQELNDCQTEITELTHFSNGFDQAKEYLQALLHCPTCPAEAPPNLFNLGASRFSCSCPSCHTTWETRICRFCGQQYPVLFPSHITRTEGTNKPGWVDRQLGSDILAVPCSRARGEVAFICSHCGKCPCSICSAVDR